MWQEGWFRSLSLDSQILLFYLRTGPHGNSLGYYYLPLPYAAADLNWSPERLDAAWRPLLELGVVSYDLVRNVVFMPEMVAESAPENPNIAKSYKHLLEGVPASVLLAEFSRAANLHWADSDQPWRVAWLEPLVAKCSAEPNPLPNSSPNTLPNLDEIENKNTNKNTNKRKNKIPPGARKKRAAPDSIVLQIQDEMKRFLGYPEKTTHDPIPNYGKESKAINRMLTRRFTREEILACWQAKVIQRGGEFASMTWVNEDIADFVRGGEPVPTVKPAYRKSERGGDTPAKKQPSVSQIFGESLLAGDFTSEKAVLSPEERAFMSRYMNNPNLDKLCYAGRRAVDYYLELMGYGKEATP